MKTKVIKVENKCCDNCANVMPWLGHYVCGAYDSGFAERKMAKYCCESWEITMDEYIEYITNNLTEEERSALEYNALKLIVE